MKNAPEQESVAAVVEQMTPALKKEYLALQKELQAADRDSLSFRFRLGETVHRIMEGDENRYGSQAVVQLSTALGITQTEAYVSATVYTQWTDEDRKSFLTRPMANGRLITFSHLAEIAVVGHSSRRRKLLEQVYKTAISTRELRKVITELVGRKRAKKMTPQKALKGLLRWVDQAEAIMNALQETEDELMANLQSYTKEKGFLELVSNLIERWNKTSDILVKINHYIYDLHVELKERAEVEQAKPQVEKEQELAPVALQGGEPATQKPAEVKKKLKVRVRKAEVTAN